MTKALGTVVLCVTLLGSTAFAQDDEMMTERRVGDVTESVFDSPLILSLRTGVIGYQGPVGDYESRLTVGGTALWNISNMLQDSPSAFIYGLESGLIFSHIGGVGANFIGRDSTVGGDSNAFTVPLNLTAGWKLSDSAMLGLHGGAILLYRSNSSSMIVGRSDGTTGDSTEFFPAVGVNAGVSLSPSIGLTVRGDYVPTPVDDLFTASLGASFGFI